MNDQNKELKKAGLKATLPRIKIMEVCAVSRRSAL